MRQFIWVFTICHCARLGDSSPQKVKSETTSIQIEISLSVGSMFRGGSRIVKWLFICIKVCGFVLLILSNFPPISHENELIISFS